MQAQNETHLSRDQIARTCYFSTFDPYSCRFIYLCLDIVYNVGVINNNQCTVFYFTASKSKITMRKISNNWL